MGTRRLKRSRSRSLGGQMGCEGARVREPGFCFDEVREFFRGLR